MNNNDDLEMTYSEGYELAQNKFNQLTNIPQTSQEWVEFFQNVSWDIYDMNGVCGVAGFITSQEVKNINVGQFSKELKTLEKSAEQYGHDSRLVDRLLPPVGRKFQGKAIDIPVDLRPVYHYDSFDGSGIGKLGSIYMLETGMHMYFPHCDIYDADNPDTLLCAGNQLDASSVKISELLYALQTILDPKCENQELSAAIERCKQYENGGSSLPAVLKKFGIGVVDLSQNSWSHVNSGSIHTNALFVELDESDHLQVTLEPNPWCEDFENPFDATEAGFGELAKFIKEAINRARN